MSYPDQQSSPPTGESFAPAPVPGSAECPIDVDAPGPSDATPSTCTGPVMGNSTATDDEIRFTSTYLIRNLGNFEYTASNLKWYMHQERHKIMGARMSKDENAVFRERDKQLKILLDGRTVIEERDLLEFARTAHSLAVSSCKTEPSSRLALCEYLSRHEFSTTMEVKLDTRNSMAGRTFHNKYKEKMSEYMTIPH